MKKALKNLSYLSQFMLVSAVVGAMIAVPFLPGVLLGSAGVRSGINYVLELPAELPDEPLAGHSTILAADGSTIATFYSENRIDVKASDLPKVMKDAIISIEDTRFYEHGAMDARGFARAMLSNLTGGQRQGGSTLTQQYVKNRLVAAATTDEAREQATVVSLNRKLREARYAAQIEQEMTKDEILAGYLNVSFFGANAYGVGAASQRYFSIPVNKLNLQQAALLAGIVQSPTRFNPLVNPEAAKNRREQVLDRMRATGRITDAEYTKAVASDLDLKPSMPANGCANSKYPYYCEWVKSIIRTDPAFGISSEARERVLYIGGLTIKTPLDTKLQDKVQAAVDAGLGRDNRVGGGLAVVQPGTGKVLAMAQNRTYGNEKEGSGEKATYLNFATSKFQTGSAFKPMTAVSLLENGWDFDSTFDVPAVFCPTSSKDQCFKNAGSTQAGTMNLSTAIARSSNNFFTVLMTKHGGVKGVTSAANRAGMNLPDVPDGDLSVTLGSYESSPLELSNSYATLLAHGVACRPVGIVSLTRNGAPFAAPDPGCKQVIEPRIADQVVTAMREVVDGDDPYRSGAKVKVPMQVAAKTGTTSSTAAVWFAGGTPDFAMALWLGDPRGGFKYPLTTVRVFGEELDSVWGSTAAAPIWQKAVTDSVSLFPGAQFTATSPTKGSVVIPDVRGMKDTVAFQVLRDAGFVPAISTKESQGSVALPPNVVTGTNPGTGAGAIQGSTVEVILSPGSDHNLIEPPR